MEGGWGMFGQSPGSGRPPLKNYRCSRCFMTTVSSRHEVWCPASGCNGLMMELDSSGIEVEDAFKDAWNSAFDGGEVSKQLMLEIYEYLAQADDI